MTQARKQTLRDLFNAEARRATQDHPKLHNGLLIVDSAHNQSSYGGTIDTLDPAASKRRADDAAFLEKLSFGAEHSFCHKRMGFNLIVMAPHVTVTNAMFGLPQHQETLFVLDHEIGHLVVEGGFYGGRDFTREACADTYALLRAGQRWGDMAPFLRANRFKRSFDLIFKGRMSHYTLPATAALAQMAPALDLAAMSPHDVAALAQKLMENNTPAGIDLAQMVVDFGSVKAAYDGNDDNIDEAARLLARMAQAETLPPLGQLTARLVLRELLAGEMLVHGKPVKLEGERWARVSEWLTRTEPRTQPLAPPFQK